MLAPIQKSNYQLYKTPAVKRPVSNRSMSLSETQKAYSEMSLRPKGVALRQSNGISETDKDLSKSNSSLIRSVSEAWRTRRSFRKKRVRADTYHVGPTFQPSKDGGIEIKVNKQPPAPNTIPPDIPQNSRSNRGHRTSHSSFSEVNPAIPSKLPAKSILKSSLRDSSSHQRRSLIEHQLEDVYDQDFRRLSEPGLAEQPNPVYSADVQPFDTQHLIGSHSPNTKQHGRANQSNLTDPATPNDINQSPIHTGFCNELGTIQNSILVEKALSTPKGCRPPALIITDHSVADCPNSGKTNTNNNSNNNNIRRRKISVDTESSPAAMAALAGTSLDQAEPICIRRRSDSAEFRRVIALKKLEEYRAKAGLSNLPSLPPKEPAMASAAGSDHSTTPVDLKLNISAGAPSPNLAVGRSRRFRSKSAGDTKALEVNNKKMGLFPKNFGNSSSSGNRRSTSASVSEDQSATANGGSRFEKIIQRIRNSFST